MPETKKDNSGVTTITGVLDSDGVTTVRVKSVPTDNTLCILDGAGGSSFGTGIAPRDNNGNPLLAAVSSSDGKTIVPLYINSSGELLIKST